MLDSSSSTEPDIVLAARVLQVLNAAAALAGVDVLVIGATARNILCTAEDLVLKAHHPAGLIPLLRAVLQRCDPVAVRTLAGQPGAIAGDRSPPQAQARRCGDGAASREPEFRLIVNSSFG